MCACEYPAVAQFETRIRDDRMGWSSLSFEQPAGYYPVIENMSVYKLNLSVFS